MNGRLRTTHRRAAISRPDVAAGSRTVLPCLLCLLCLLCGLLSGALGCTSAAYTARVGQDAEVSRKANAALAAAGLDPRRIEAQSYCGVVVLLGSADEAERDEARQIVAAVPGVVRVNNLVLTEGTSPASGFARAKKAPLVARGEIVPDSK